MLTKEDLQAIAGLFVPLETQMGRFEGRLDNLEVSLRSLDKHVCELDTKVAKLDAKVTELDTKVTELDGKVTELDIRVTELDTSVRNLWLHVENSTDVKIQTVAENHLNLYRKLDELQKEKGKWERVFFFVNKHENDINEIKQHLHM